MDRVNNSLDRYLLELKLDFSSNVMLPLENLLNIFPIKLNFRTPVMSKNILIISSEPTSSWTKDIKSTLDDDFDVGVVRDTDIKHLASNYCLLIFDIASPDHDYKSVLEKLPKEFTATHFIVVTSSPSWENAREAFRNGASDYITRKLDIREIVQSCKRLLKSQQFSKTK